MSSNRRKVKVGFVGCGVFATRYHLANAKKNPVFDIRALCDLDKRILEDRKTRFGNPKTYTTTDYRDLLADKELDFIFIATGHRFHGKLIPEGARAGKNMFVEKPMAVTARECRAIIEAVRENNVKLMTGYNRRFAPAYIDAKEIFNKIRGDNFAMYHYRIVDDVMTWDNREHYMSGGSAASKIVVEACHVMDFLSWFSDSEPARVHAEGKPEGDAVINIKFSNGDAASIVTGGLGSQYFPKENFEVFCSRATISVQSMLELVFSSPDRFERKTYPYGKDTYKITAGESGFNNYLRRLQEYKKDHSAGKVTPADEPNPDKGHYGEIAAFADAILNDKPSPVDEFSGSRATVMALKVYKAVATGKLQEINSQDYRFGL